MNLNFVDGFRLRFGIGLDSGQCMDEGALIGVQRVGPRGLLTEFERSLGLPSVELTVTERVSCFRELLGAVADDGEPFWKSSLAVDQYAVAQDLLRIRDEFVLAGWDFTADTQAPQRLRDLSTLERDRALSGPTGDLRGIADRYRAVVSALASGDRRDGIPGIASIECADRRDLLPRPWSRLLTMLDDAGLMVTERPIVAPMEEPNGFSNRERLLAILRDQSDEASERGARIELDHERTVFVIRGGTVAEYAQHIARGTLGFAVNGGRQAIIAPRASATLATAFAHVGHPRPRAGADAEVPPVAALVRLLPAFLFDPLDVDRVAEFLSVRPNPLGSAPARRLLRALQNRPGLGSTHWKQAVEKLDEKQRAAYEAWFGLVRVPEGEPCPATKAVLPFERLGSWARRMAHTPGGMPVNWLSLESTCRRITEQITAAYADGISRLQLEQLIARMVPSEDGMRAEAGAVPVFSSAAELDALVDSLVWMPFCATSSTDGALYDWLREDERRWLAERGVTLDTPEDLAMRERAEVARAVEMARTVWLCVPDHDDGEPVRPHPVYQFLTARREASSFTHTLDELTGSLPELTFTAPPALRDEWHLAEIPVDSLEQSISFTRLNTLLTVPHAWVAEYAAGLTPTRGYAVPHGAWLYGSLAHDLADAWFSRADWSDLGPSDFSAWFRTAFDEYVRTVGTPLVRPGREAERARVRAVTHDGVFALDRLLRERGWRPVAAESDLTGTIGGKPVHGRADVLCTTGEGEEISVVIDLKWQGEPKRREEVESGSAWQLGFYAAISGAPPDEVEAGYFILDRRRLVALGGGDPMVQTMTALEAHYRQRRDELTEGRVVLPAREDLAPWDAYRFLVGWGK
ncbi:MAG: PD-(D/E)XK nuclease family protein [Alkalispirochaeta sp.]